MRTPRREPSNGQPPRLAAAVAQITSTINARQPETNVLKALRDAQVLCEEVGGQSAGELQILVQQLNTVLDAWQRVWPRMGQQQDFRLAVSREAELWSRRLLAQAKSPERVG